MGPKIWHSVTISQKSFIKIATRSGENQFRQKAVEFVQGTPEGAADEEVKAKTEAKNDVITFMRRVLPDKKDANQSLQFVS